MPSDQFDPSIEQYNSVILISPDLHVFDGLSDSDSDVSIISDPFSIASVNIATQRESLIGENLLHMFNFSAPLQSIFAAYPTSDIKTMMCEALDQIRKKNIFTQVKKKVPLIAQIKIVNLLNSGDMNATPQIDQFIPDEKKTWEDLKDEVLSSRNMLKNIRRLTEKERSRKLLQEQTDLVAFETMSGYWRLLGGYEDFQIAPPGFDSYRADKEECGHWLQMDPLSAGVIDESRSKVLTWFSKYFPQSLLPNCHYSLTATTKK